MTVARQAVIAWRALARDDLPASVLIAARLHFLDAVGVGLAASALSVGEPYRAFARDLSIGPASIFGLPTGTRVADAALVNGGLIHSLEFDDTHTASIVHGSAVLAPVALAAAESASVSGRRLLGAFARGWEFLVRIGLSAPGRFQARGFQVTSVAGAMVAALVAADLFDLDEAQTVAAVGIALSQGSGVFEFLTNGSSVKSLHPGWAAHAGVIAVRLAHAGMTGPETSIEGRYGLYRVFAGDDQAAERFQTALADIGRIWYLLDAAYKFYPCCHYLHPFIEAAGILADRGIRADEITHILCRVPAGAASVICEPWNQKCSPETGHAARWSLPIVVAARLVEGKVSLETFEHPPSCSVRALGQRIAWEPLVGAKFPQRFEAEVICTITDGTHQTIRIDDVYGNVSRPARENEVRAKFRANASRVLCKQSLTKLESAIDHLEDRPELSELSGSLRAVGTDQ